MDRIEKDTPAAEGLRRTRAFVALGDIATRAVLTIGVFKGIEQIGEALGDQIPEGLTVGVAAVAANLAFSGIRYLHRNRDSSEGNGF